MLGLPCISDLGQLDQVEERDGTIVRGIGQTIGVEYISTTSSSH